MTTETARAAGPQRGERYTKDGVTCVVHEVRDGKVYGHRYDARTPAGPFNPWAEPHCLFRITLPEWHAATAGATKETGGAE